MIKHELDGLEIQLKELSGLFQQVLDENASLRKKLNNLTNEHSALVEKNKKLAENLRQVIKQLQDKLLCQIKKS